MSLVRHVPVVVPNPEPAQEVVIIVMAGVPSLTTRGSSRSADPAAVVAAGVNESTILVALATVQGWNVDPGR